MQVSVNTETVATWAGVYEKIARIITATQWTQETGSGLTSTNVTAFATYRTDVEEIPIYATAPDTVDWPTEVDPDYETYTNTTSTRYAASQWTGTPEYYYGALGGHSGDTMTYEIVANGSIGTATVTDVTTGAFKYLPNENTTGDDSFTFKATDSATGNVSSTKTVYMATS